MSEPSSESVAICHTQVWLQQVIVGLNFCPFAKRELLRESIEYRPISSDSEQAILEKLAEEFQFLDQHPDSETSLLILLGSHNDFYNYLDLLDKANRLLQRLDYEGIYQLASFHPDYRFADADAEDPSNYTNRSPYPIIHILREASIERVLKSYKNPEDIPNINIKKARELGSEALKALLKPNF